MNGHNLSISNGRDDPFASRLRRLTQLKETDRNLLQSLCGSIRQVGAKRAELAREGDRVVRLHVLLDRWACRFKLLPDGHRLIVSVLLPGDFFDLGSQYVTRTDYSVGALTACTVAAIDCSTLRDLAAQKPAVCEALAFLMALDNAMLTKRSTCLGRQSARERVSYLLCELLVRLTLARHARGNGFALPIIQEEIGDVVGLTAVHVNHVLRRLRIDGLIEQRSHLIVILEWNLLRTIAAFRPGYLHLENVEESKFNVGQAPRAVQAKLTDHAGFDARV